MMSLGLLFAKLTGKILHSREPVNDYYRRGGVKIGKGCMICSSPLTMEPSLIEIGDNVVISTKVTFVTHDNSVKYVHPGKTDVFGKIVIGNNCFIGENSTLLYGVRIEDNVIVAAGSVVTKSIKESNVIVGGNPARVISTWDKFRDKTKSAAVRRENLYEALDKLVKGRVLDEA